MGVTLDIRDIPDDLMERLRLRARASGRSVEEEVLQIFTDAVSESGKRLEELRRRPQERAPRNYPKPAE